MGYLQSVMFLSVFLIVGCGNTSSVDIEETGQQVGDVMASIDESGGSNGSLASLEGNGRLFDRLDGPVFLEWLYEFTVPTAFATSCALSNTFSSCASNTITRTFGGCTIGGATFTGAVTLTWGGASSNCGLSGTSDTITRSPNFTVTGRRGATLTVSKTGTIGQLLTWSSGSGTSKQFSFTNDGIRRVFTSASGTALFDFTTQTQSAITVTGTTRLSRTLSGGALRVTNNASGVYCDYVPSLVSWSSACTCANSGTWSGACSDGKTTSIEITGCGSGKLTVGSDSQSFTFDRCYGVD